MKRTIKFRGYNKKNNKWIYGYYLVNRGQHFIVEDGIANPLNTWEDYLVEEETIGQFTGLLDKNGVEIYPNDIISSLNRRVVGYVVDSVRAYCYDVVWIKHPSDEKRWTLWGVVEIDNNGNIEVIGNTYDNPELINGKEKQQ